MSSDLPTLPVIVVRAKVQAFVEHMRNSLVRAEGLYKRDDQIVEVVCDKGERPAGVDRARDAPKIRVASRATVRGALSVCADYVRVVRTLRDGTEVTQECVPPEHGIDGIFSHQDLPLPHLEGIVESPVILRSGAILDTPGYDRYSGLIYHPTPGVAFLPVPDHPTANDIKSALQWLYEAVYDFPFEKPAHRSAWIAGVLSYFARWSFTGPTPLFLVDGNVRGSGKGKLVNAAAQICLGRKPLVVQQTSDEEKEKELLTGVALSGAMMVLIDNISRPFGSAVLDSLLTEGVLTQVLKYQNEHTHLNFRALMWANGNNVEFRKGNDTIRRSLKIRIESPHENPEQRSDFKRPEPEYGKWLQAHRPWFVWSALTLLRGFIQAGSPTAGLPSWGSFEGWSRLVRGTLVWAGEPDPYEVAAIHDKSSDSAVEALGDVLRGWQALCAEMKMDALTASEAITELRCHIEYAKEGAGRKNPHEQLINALCELSPPRSGRLPDPAALGYVLRKSKNRVVDGLRLESAQPRDHRTTWTVRSKA